MLVLLLFMPFLLIGGVGTPAGRGAFDTGDLSARQIAHSSDGVKLILHHSGDGLTDELHHLFWFA